MDPKRTKHLKKTKDVIKGLVTSSKYKNGMSVNRLRKVYLKVVGKRLSGALFGYENVQEFLQKECADILEIVTLRHKTILRPVLNDKSKSIKGPMTPPESDEKDRGLGEVLKNLQCLIAKHKTLLGSELSYFYMTHFKKPLDIGKLGFRNIWSLIESFPEFFMFQKPHLTDDWVVHDQSVDHEKEFWTTDKYEENLGKEHRSESLNSLILALKSIPRIHNYSELAPEDCIPFGHKLKLVEPPSPNTKFQIFVSEILDPSHFWCHIRSPHHSEALNLLMTKIDEFYKLDKNIYRMTREQMEPGRYCAVKFCNVYHRALILRNISEEVIKVRYIDYGMIGEISTDDVRLLLEKFALLEEQALPARLHGVRPVDHVWSHEARTLFSKLTMKKLLVAHVRSVDQEKVSSLMLVDMNRQFSSIISEVLCQEKVAKFILKDKKDWKLSDYAYLLPSFKNLNSGCYPTFADFERNTEKSLLFKDLLSSFCDMSICKIPSIHDIPTVSKIFDLNRSVNDTAVNHFIAPNFHPPSYGSGTSNFEYASNHPIFGPSYDPYRQSSTITSMEAQYNPPKPSYAEDDLERLSGHGTFSRSYDRPQIDRVVKRIQFDDIDQNLTPPNDESMSNVENNLTLVDSLCIAGQDIDIWKLKYSNENLKYTFVLLEQILYKFFENKPEYQQIWNKLNQGQIHGRPELFQIKFHQLSVLRRIENFGRCDAIIGDCIELDSVSKNIFKTEDNLILWPLDYISHFLISYDKELKVNCEDILKDLLPICRKNNY